MCPDRFPEKAPCRSILVGYSKAEKNSADLRKNLKACSPAQEVD